MKRTALILISLSVMAFSGWREEHRKADKEKNPEKACKILQEEVNKRNFQAMWFLAMSYETIGGCKEGTVDYKKAYLLYSKLAGYNYGLGYQGLSRMYGSGLGIKVDHKKAFDYMLKAAEGKRSFD